MLAHRRSVDTDFDLEVFIWVDILRDRIAWYIEFLVSFNHHDPYSFRNFCGSTILESPNLLNIVSSFSDKVFFERTVMELGLVSGLRVVVS